MSADRKKRSFGAGALLIAGAVLGGSLAWDALTQPLAGSAAVLQGSEPADPTSVDLPTGRHAAVPDGPTTLVVWDEQPDVASNELAASFAANLAGHFGPVTWQPSATVTTADLDAADAVIYVGTRSDPALSPDLIDAALTADRPFLWLGFNLSQLVAADPTFATRVGWQPGGDAVAGAETVEYRGVELPRVAAAGALATIDVLDPTNVEVLAEASQPDGTVSPYAVRSGNLFWMAEAPFDYPGDADRGLVLGDVLFDLLDPDRPERHRGLVRLEDVGPWADPDALRSIADELSARGVPFSVAVYPVWSDPQAAYGLGTDIRLADRPEVVDALDYMQERGGTLIMHGVTHQHGEGPNPYTGASGEDFEFYLTHIAANDDVVLDRPVADDSTEWMHNRIRWGLAEFADAGLDVPTIFEFPHYAASDIDYRAIESVFDARYERVLYVDGLLSGRINQDAFATQDFPYPVIDLYGERVIPENLGNFIAVGYNNNDPRSAQDIVDNAARSLVVRDNVASFFFHPYLDPQPLLDIVDGIEALGYDFVSPADILED